MPPQQVGNALRGLLSPIPTVTVTPATAKKTVVINRTQGERKVCPTLTFSVLPHLKAMLAKKGPTPGNPDAVDADGFLVDIEVQSVDEGEGPADADRTQDVKEFFYEPFAKEVIAKDGKKKSKLYRKCKLCP